MRNLKKTLSILLLSFFVFTLMPKVAYAQGREAVTTVNLNFRDQGTIHSNVLGEIPQGETLKVFESKGNWTQVEYKGQTGWVSTKYIVPSEELQVERAIQSLKPEILRAEPSSNSKEIGKIEKGAVASLLAIDGHWYKVNQDGKVGYVLATNWIDKPLNQKPVVSEKVDSTDGTFELFLDIPVYISAADAKSQKNSVGTYSSGEYEIYRNFSGMVNITRHPGVPGAWINPEQNTDKAPEVEKAPEESEKSDANEAEGDSYELLTSVDTYVSAYDAMNETNAVGKYTKGTYYVFKNFGGMLNLTKVKGSPGAWINPKYNIGEEVVAPEQPKEEPEDTIVTHSRVNVRKGPSNAFEILRMLPAGTNAVMVGRESNWLKIEYKGQIGYSYIDYWNVPEKTMNKFTPKPESKPEEKPEEKPGNSRKYKVFLDPGHNGIGQGAVSTITGEVVDEATINYRVAILTKDILEERGYEVYLSKKNLEHSVSLTNRTNNANKLGADIFVSIHTNAFTNSSAKGTIGFFGGEKLNPATSDWQLKSQLLAEKLANSVGSIFGSGKTVKDTDYGISYAVNRLSNMPSTLLELGFITNYHDAMILDSAASQKEIAKEIANGIDQYFAK